MSTGRGCDVDGRAGRAACDGVLAGARADVLMRAAAGDGAGDTVTVAGVTLNAAVVLAAVVATGAITVLLVTGVRPALAALSRAACVFLCFCCILWFASILSFIARSLATRSHLAASRTRSRARAARRRKQRWSVTMARKRRRN